MPINYNDLQRLKANLRLDSKLFPTDNIDIIQTFAQLQAEIASCVNLLYECFNEKERIMTNRITGTTTRTIELKNSLFLAEQRLARKVRDFVVNVKLNVDVDTHGNWRDWFNSFFRALNRLLDIMGKPFEPYDYRPIEAFFDRRFIKTSTRSWLDDWSKYVGSICQKVSEEEQAMKPVVV